MSKRWRKTKSGGEGANFVVWVTRDDWDIARKEARCMGWTVAEALSSLLAEGAANRQEAQDEREPGEDAA